MKIAEIADDKCHFPCFRAYSCADWIRDIDLQEVWPAGDMLEDVVDRIMCEALYDLLVGKLFLHGCMVNALLNKLIEALEKGNFKATKEQESALEEYMPEKAHLLLDKPEYHDKDGFPLVLGKYRPVLEKYMPEMAYYLPDKPEQEDHDKDGFPLV